MRSVDRLLLPVLDPVQQAILLVLAGLWALATGLYWAWWLQPAHWAGAIGMVLNTALLFYVSGMPAWAYLFVLRMRRVNPAVAWPAGLRVAMVVTKAPSEPWSLVRQTLEAMLAQEPCHDTWLADEDPTAAVLQWCREHGVRVSCRRDAEGYHNPCWPRRRRCKEGNLAYFYDHYGYVLYDVVVQLDADHRPEPGYLRAMVRPFADPGVGYVAAPSICDRNAAQSWVARGRLHAEANLHGPMQLGSHGSWAPLCFGSHYAVRTAALRQIGGLGPELAEDHSTTLLFNSHGWRGVFAGEARAHGLGPATFEDAMVQEFQWSRSLTTILLTLTPRLLHALPARMRLQFLYSQLFYALRGGLSVVGLLLPAGAMALAHPWVRIDYPLFFVLSMLQIGLGLLPILWLRSLGLLNPSGSPLMSWEQLLFEVSRGPWVLAGVLAAWRDRLWPGQSEFRVTRKGQQRQQLPLRSLMPHLLIALFGAAAALSLGHRAGEATGYVLLVLLSALLSALSVLCVVLLDRRFRLLGPLRHGHHALVALGAVAVVLLAALWRQQQLLLPLQGAAGLSASPLWRP